MWNDACNIGSCLNSDAESTKRIPAPFSPLSFPAQGKRYGRRRRVRNDHDGTNPCKQGFLSSVLVSSFPNRKLNLRFGSFPADLRQPLSQPYGWQLPWKGSLCFVLSEAFGFDVSRVVLEGKNAFSAAAADEDLLIGRSRERPVLQDQPAAFRQHRPRQQKPSLRRLRDLRNTQDPVRPRDPPGFHRSSAIWAVHCLPPVPRSYSITSTQASSCSGRSEKSLSAAYRAAA